MSEGPRRLQVLHLEDDPRDAELVCTTLAAEGVECDVTRVETRKAFAAALEAGGWDVILADYQLPTFDGITAQSLALERLPDTPFIFVSGTFGEEVAVERLKTGATDYVLKDRLSRLAPCMQRALREAEDRRQRQLAQAELRRLNAELEQRVAARTQALRDSELFLESVVENLPNMLFVKDARDLRFVRVNRAGEALLGYSRDELLGKNDHDFFEPGEAEFFTAKDREVLRIGDVVDIPEEPIHTRHRGVRLLHTKKIPIPDESGRPRYLLGISEDITDRRLAERAFAESQQRLQAIIDNSPAVISLKDVEGRYILVNRRFETLFHTTSDEVRGKADRDIFPPVLADVYRENDRRVLVAGRPLEVEEIAVHDDGSHVYASIKFPVPGIDGAPVALCGISIDITERKMADDAIKMARLEAVQANRAKSEFLSRMSHDLRTPLNAILGFAQILDSDALSADERECVAQIFNAGEHLLALINEVLDITRIETGHLALSPEPVLAVEIVHRAIDLVAPLAARRKVTMHEQVATSNDRYVRADRQRLSQILLNLLSNAVKYNRDGGEVFVSCSERTPDRLRISVRDTGAGIAADKLGRLFRPFDRLGAEQTAIEGTGLGLTVARELAVAMGGALEVESEVGVGSTFWIELPLVAAPVDAPAVERSSVPDPRAVRGEARGRVLYVDDNRSNARLLERVFARRPGVTLLTAALGGEGIRVARRDRPDLILLDLHLPDMQGEDVLRELKGDAATRDIPVAILSADATAGQDRRLEEAGAIAFLTKPLEIARVLRLVDETLSGARRRR